MFYLIYLIYYILSIDKLYIIYSLYYNIFIHILYLIYLNDYSYVHLFVTINECLTLLDVLVKLSCFTIHMTQKILNNVKQCNVIIKFANGNFT